jgi:hypothetical protein
MRLMTDDIVDLDAFKMSLEEYFSEMGFGVKPEDVIVFKDPVVEDWEDQFSDDEDEDLELISFQNNGDVFFSGRVIEFTPKPKKTRRDDYDYSYRPPLPQSDKTWDPIPSPPPSPVVFENPKDIEYPPTPTTPRPPPYRETFDNFITNGLVGENGRIKGKIPTPYNYLLSIKVGEAIRLRVTKLKNGGFTIVGRPIRPRLLKPKATKPKTHVKSQICRHGKDCPYRKQGKCKFAHTLKEWQPKECSCDDLNCKKFHPHRERKIEYYKRMHKK